MPICVPACVSYPPPSPSASLPFSLAIPPILKLGSRYARSSPINRSPFELLLLSLSALGFHLYVRGGDNHTSQQQKNKRNTTKQHIQVTHNTSSCNQKTTYKTASPTSIPPPPQDPPMRLRRKWRCSCSRPSSPTPGNRRQNRIDLYHIGNPKPCV